jgi:hypothetical protein
MHINNAFREQKREMCVVEIRIYWWQPGLLQEMLDDTKNKVEIYQLHSSFWYRKCINKRLASGMMARLFFFSFLGKSG